MTKNRMSSIASTRHLSIFNHLKGSIFKFSVISIRDDFYLLGLCCGKLYDTLYLYVHDLSTTVDHYLHISTIICSKIRVCSCKLSTSANSSLLCKPSPFGPYTIDGTPA